MQSWLVAGAAIACCWGRGLGGVIKLYCVCMCRVVTCRVFLVSCSFVCSTSDAPSPRVPLAGCVSQGASPLLESAVGSSRSARRRSAPPSSTTMERLPCASPHVCARRHRLREVEKEPPPTAKSAERRRSSLVAGCRHSAFIVDGACRPVGAKARGRSKLWCRRCLIVVPRRCPAIESGADENARS